MSTIVKSGDPLKEKSKFSAMALRRGDWVETKICKYDLFPDSPQADMQLDQVTNRPWQITVQPATALLTDDEQKYELVVLLSTRHTTSFSYNKSTKELHMCVTHFYRAGGVEIAVPFSFRADVRMGENGMALASWSVPVLRDWMNYARMPGGGQESEVELISGMKRPAGRRWKPSVLDTWLRRCSEVMHEGAFIATCIVPKGADYADLRVRDLQLLQQVHVHRAEVEFLRKNVPLRIVRRAEVLSRLAASREARYMRSIGRGYGAAPLTHQQIEARRQQRIKWARERRENDKQWRGVCAAAGGMPQRNKAAQARFRREVFHNCAGRCLMSGWEQGRDLEAAHLEGIAEVHAEWLASTPPRMPWEQREAANLNKSNGMLLHRTLHTAFDWYLIGIDPQTMAVRIHPDWLSCPPAIKRLEGRRLRPTEVQALSRTKLAKRWDQFVDNRLVPSAYAWHLHCQRLVLDNALELI